MDMEYEKIVEKIEQATDPRLTAEKPKLAFMILEEADPVLGQIMLLRQALRWGEDDLESDHPHAAMMREEIAINSAKIEKTIHLLIRDYARVVEQTFTCTCERCRAAAAPFN